MPRISQPLPKINQANLNWLAGLIEGEGSFGFYSRGACFHITMTDEDVMRRVSSYINTPIWIYDRNSENRKTQYRITVGGKKALQLMEILYPYMGKRRQAKILEIKEKADATASSRRVAGVAGSSGNSGSKGSNSGKNSGSPKGTK